MSETKPLPGPPEGCEETAVPPAPEAAPAAAVAPAKPDEEPKTRFYGPI